jgi:mannose-6-phosphate isomerase
MSEYKIFQVQKPWGNFRQFIHNTSSTVKIITIHKEEMLSLQSHSKRTEFWYVISGFGIMEIGDATYKVIKGDEKIVPIGIKHRIKAGKDGMIVLEIATGYFDEEDIVRYEDKYGRIV